MIVILMIEIGVVVVVVMVEPVVATRVFPSVDFHVCIVHVKVVVAVVRLIVQNTVRANIAKYVVFIRIHGSVFHVNNM